MHHMTYDIRNSLLIWRIADGGVPLHLPLPYIDKRSIVSFSLPSFCPLSLSCHTLGWIHCPQASCQTPHLIFPTPFTAKDLLTLPLSHAAGLFFPFKKSTKVFYFKGNYTFTLSLHLSHFMICILNYPTYAVKSKLLHVAPQIKNLTTCDLISNL